jgi:hypothetical protein
MRPLGQIESPQEAREILARRVAQIGEARRRRLEVGFRVRYERLRARLTEALERAALGGASAVANALRCAAPMLLDLSSLRADPIQFRRGYARLSNFLRAADTLARQTRRPDTLPAIRAGLSAAFALAWWWKVNVQRATPEDALIWLSGTRHSFA